MVLGLLDQLQIFLVVFDRNVRAFSRSGATRAVALDISKAFDKVSCRSSSQIKSYGISGQTFGLTSLFLSKRHLLEG